MNQSARIVIEERRIGKDSMDKARVMGMHRAQFPANPIRSISQEYYEWKAFKNPVTTGDIFLEMKDGRSVGSAVVMPRKLAIQDEIVLAAETADAFTLPECRGQGINTKILGIAIDWAISQGMNLIYGPPNEANYGTHLRLGYKPCEYTNWAFLRKSLNPAWLAAKLTAKIILGKETQKSAHRLRHLSKRLKKRGQPLQSMYNSSKHDFSITTIDRFHHEVDPLWGKPRYSFFVYRDKQYLNWRYFDHPDTFIVLAAVKGEAYLGYIVLKLSNNKRTGILCDFVTVDDRSDVFFALVGEAEKILKQSGAGNIQLRCTADSPYYEVFKTLNYYNPGPGSNHPVFVNAKTEMGKRVLESPGRWHLTFGDTDEV